jgi:hypothetical protein
MKKMHGAKPIQSEIYATNPSTGFFSSSALTLAARVIESLVRNNGRMRLVVGCTLAQAEMDAIEKGLKLRDAVEQKIGACPLDPGTIRRTIRGQTELTLILFVLIREFTS